ncbi:MAG: carboxypeptidase regulatory-like domain-containing protein [Nitrospirae bacterium]|nr:carboxypeptidase regulatory-like domain-containing protein [Nitrospirota bacterium]
MKGSIVNVKDFTSGIAFVLFTLLCTPAAVAQAYEGIVVAKGGELAGNIKAKGAAPENEVHKVIHNPEYCGDSISEETYLVNPENNGLQNTVVSLEGITKGKKHDPATLVLENLKCRFVPHVLAGMAGDSYEIRNGDPILHNTHLRLEGTTILNVAMPENGKNIKKPLTQSGTIGIKCDAHPFMTGALWVFDHPYFAVTDKNGEFKISDIPPGTYKVTIWHEGVPIKEKEVTIAPGGKTNLSADLSLK